MKSKSSENTLSALFLFVSSVAWIEHSVLRTYRQKKQVFTVGKLFFSSFLFFFYQLAVRFLSRLGCTAIIYGDGQINFHFGWGSTGEKMI